VSQYDVVLSLHILSMVLGFGVAGVAHSTMFRLRAATEMRQVREHLAVLEKVGPFFGIAALLLLVFGAYLIQIAPSDADIGWGEGWIITALVSLVLVEAVGGVVIGRRVTALLRKLEAAPDGPVGDDTRVLLADRPIWMASHATTAVIASVVFLMVGKPPAAGAVTIVVIGALVGMASAVPLAKPVPAKIG
jgi:hypothetical protein